jgi:hypothetical protein
MGIDVHTLKFLLYERKLNGVFGFVATLGRQGLDVPAYCGLHRLDDTRLS